MEKTLQMRVTQPLLEKHQSIPGANTGNESIRAELAGCGQVSAWRYYSQMQCSMQKRNVRVHLFLHLLKVLLRGAIHYCPRPPKQEGNTDTWNGQIKLTYLSCRCILELQKQRLTLQHTDKRVNKKCLVSEILTLLRTS
jgi:hypothetical protein